MRYGTINDATRHERKTSLLSGRSVMVGTQERADWKELAAQASKEQDRER